MIEQNRNATLKFIFLLFVVGVMYEAAHYSDSYHAKRLDVMREWSVTLSRVGQKKFVRNYD